MKHDAITIELDLTEAKKSLDEYKAELEEVLVLQDKVKENAALIFKKEE